MRYQGKCLEGVKKKGWGKEERRIEKPQPVIRYSYLRAILQKVHSFSHPHYVRFNRSDRENIRKG